jgi:hypothetical protein
MLEERSPSELQTETEEPLPREIAEPAENQLPPEVPTPETAEPTEPEPPILLGAPPEPALLAETPPEMEETPLPEPEPEVEPNGATEKPGEAARKSKEPQPAGEIINVTAGQLFAEYKANAVAADARYQGQVVQLTGIVDSIDRDMLDYPFVKLSSEDRGEMLRMRCTFPEKSEDKLLKLTAGQIITVRGNYDGYLVNILLKDCVLVEE